MTENYNTLLGDGNDVPLSGEESAPELPLAQSDAVMALASATSELARAISKISYTPTQWVDNSEPDINAANLNKIEQGILQATTAINGAVDAINAINTDLRFYSTTNGITKIASLPWGIYNLQDSEVRALTDKPSELNQGRAIIITSGLSTNDEKVALILASSGRDGGVYFGYVWGSNTPEFSWKKIIGNNA